MTKGSVPLLLVTNSPCLARKQAAYRNGEASFKEAEHSPAELSHSLIPYGSFSLQTPRTVITTTAHAAAVTVSVACTGRLREYRDSRENVMG